MCLTHCRWTVGRVLVAGDGSRLSLSAQLCARAKLLLSSAGGSWVTPSRHQWRGLALQPGLPPVAVGSLCSGEQLQQVEPSTAQDLKPRSLCCAVGAHRVILGVAGRTAPSSAFEIELRDLVKWSRFIECRETISGS